MFSSNETPAEEYVQADKQNAIINLDDFTHIDFLKETIGYIPETISCRYNPGGVFTLGESEEGFQVMDNPGEAKYGFTQEQIIEGYQEAQGPWAQSTSASTPSWPPTPFPTTTIPPWQAMLFELAVELKEKTGCHITFINLSGGVGVPYRPEQRRERHRSHRRWRARNSMRRSWCLPAWMT